MSDQVDVLLVDDCADIRLFLAEELASYGLRVRESLNGEDALKELETQLPALVLTDIHMPKMNGIEFLKKARRRFPDLPIYVMTGDSPYSRSAVLALGATEFFDKVDLLKIVTFLSSQIDI